MRPRRTFGTCLIVRYDLIAAICLPVSSALAFIEARAWLSDEMTKALSIRAKNMIELVTINSTTVTGLTWRSPSEVITPAPQKKACMYFMVTLASFLSQWGGCHSFVPLDSMA